MSGFYFRFFKSKFLKFNLIFVKDEIKSAEVD